MENISNSENLRLKVVQKYISLGLFQNGSFDHVAEVAREYFACKAAVVSIVDRDSIWLKAHSGLNVDRLDVAEGLCASAVMQDEPWIINDALVDPRSLANPLVAGELGLRFYAGVPLKIKSGSNLGVLAVIDFEPREVSDEQLSVLKKLAKITVEIIELRFELSARLNVMP